MNQTAKKAEIRAYGSKSASMAAKSAAFFIRLAPLFITLVLILSTSGTVFGQKTQEDVVYLKNGSMVRGEILILIPDSIVRIRIMGGSEFVFKWEEIDRIQKEPVKNAMMYRKLRIHEPRRSGPINFKEDKVYINTTEVGLFAGSGGIYSSGVAFSISNVTSYKVSPHFMPGLGIGIDRYVFTGTLLPFFADLRGDFKKNKKATGYYFGQAGYAWPILQGNTNIIEYEGGVMAHAGLGFHLYTRSKASYLLGFGYRFQRTRRVFEEQFDPWSGLPGGIVDLKNYYTRFTINLGISF